MIKRKDEFTKNLNKVNVCLDLIIALSDYILKKYKKEFLENIHEYIKPELFKLKNDEISAILRYVFNDLAKNKMYDKGYNFFIKFKNMSKPTEYYNFKAYILYFSHCIHKFDEIEEILYDFANFKSDISTIDEHRDYNLYLYYKGLIHLDLKEYNFAAFSFLKLCMSNTKNQIVLIDTAQVHGLIYLLLVLPFLDSYMNANIASSISDFRYYQQNKSTSKEYQLLELASKNCNILYESLNQYIIENEITLKANNQYGFAKYSLLESATKIMISNLKKFKRITLSKLAKLSNIPIDVIQVALKNSVLNGKIEIRYDEEKDIIDVINVNLNAQEKMKELKNYYQKLNNASINTAEDDLLYLAQHKDDKKNLALGLEF